MYIGILNQKCSELQYTCTAKDRKTTPQMLCAGNPFAGETLSIGWAELRSEGIDLHTALPQEYYLCSAVLTLGETCAPRSVSLYTKDKSRLLYRYSGETGKAITGKEITLSAETVLSEFVIEIDSDLSDVVIENITLYGACLEGEQLFPTPNTVKTSGGVLSVSGLHTISRDCEAALEAVCVLREKFAEATEQTLTEAETGEIRFVKDETVPENGYTLTAADTGIVLKASDTRGFVIGAETLLKLIKDDAIPCCEIEDAPFCEFRGVHLFLPAEEQMDFAKRLIKYILSPMGYNYIFLEIGGAMRFDSHPEINEAYENAVAKGKSGEWPAFPHEGVGGGKTVSKASVRDFVAYARSFGIEVIPEIQSLGHVQYLTVTYPELAERAADDLTADVTDARAADIPPSKFYAHCYCPSNPKSYEILFDIMEEILDTVQPKKYVHMGHDEVYQIGICPVCKDKDPAELYAQDVQRIYDFLKARGYQMMIWADMIQPITKYRTPAALHKIPKDIILLDFIWYFHVEKDIEDNLLTAGFDVLAGNMYSSHYPRYESRIRKQGMRGAQISCWIDTTEEALAREGKLYDMLLSAQMMWSESYNSHLRYAYDKVLCTMLPTLREKMQAVCHPSLHGGEPTALLQHDLFDPKAVTDELCLAVNEKLASVQFDHAVSVLLRKIPWLPVEEIGCYTVCYEDGTQEKVPVTFGGNIGWWGRRQNAPFPGQYFRHTGYASTWYSDSFAAPTVCGGSATVYRYEWVNPKPDTYIREIRYLPAENAPTEVIVHGVTGIR